MNKIALIPLVLLLVTNPVMAIKKCKDADGNWHYGDTAVEACNTSKITTLNKRGVITDEEAPPKTDEELAAEKQAALEEEKRVERELAAEEERRRILNIYESEDDILRQRDNQLSSVQGNIDVHKAYLKNMDARIDRYQKQLAVLESEAAKKSVKEKIADASKRVETSTKELEALELQKKRIQQKFAKERYLYLSYKSGIDPELEDH